MTDTTKTAIKNISTSGAYVDHFGTEHLTELPENVKLIDFITEESIAPGDCFTARLGIRSGEFVLIDKRNVRKMKLALIESLSCKEEELNIRTLKNSLMRIQRAMDRANQEKLETAAFWQAQDLNDPKCPVYSDLKEAAADSSHVEKLLWNHLANGSDEVSESFAKKFADGMIRLHQTRDAMLGEKEGGDTFGDRGEHLPWFTESVIPQFLEDVPKRERPWSNYHIWLVSIGEQKKVIVARNSEFGDIKSALQQAWRNAKELRANGNKNAWFRFTDVNLPTGMAELQFQNACEKKIQAWELKAAGGPDAINPLVQKLKDNPAIVAYQAKLQEQAQAAASAQVDPTRKGKGRRPKGKHSHA